MKLRKILLLSLGMALCAGGGVGIAFAQVYKNSASNTGTASFDKAIYLYWGSGSETAEMEDMDASETAQYRYLEVSPKYSSTLSGNVTLTFTIAPQQEGATKTAVTKGISIRVLELSELATSGTFADYIATGTQKLSLSAPASGESASGSFNFAVGESGSGVHETVKKYAIEVVWAPAGVSQTEQVSAVLRIAQSFAA